MSLVVNVSSGTRSIGGKTLAPGEMGHVDLPSAKLADHLFVRCGDIEVSKTTVSTGKAKSKPAKSDSSEGSEAE